MDKLIGILKIVMPVLVMISIGFLCKKRNIIKKEGITGLKTFAVKIIIPFIIIKGFYNASFNFDILIIAIVMFLCCSVAFILGFLIKRLTRTKLRTLPFLMTGFEAGMFGYALYTLLFGADNVSYMVLICLGTTLFIFTIYISMLLPSSNTITFKDSLKNIAKSRMFIAIVIGLTIGITGLGALIDNSAAGEIVKNILDIITSPIAAIILLVVGYELDFGKINIKLTLITVFSRLIIMGLLCFAVITLLDAVISINEYLRWAFILLFMLPPPFISVYVDDENENALLCPTLFIYTIITLIVFTVIAYIIA